MSDCIAQLKRILQKRIRLIDGIIGVLIGDEKCTSSRQESTHIPEAIGQTLPLMLQALGSSANTVVQLSEAPGLQTRDCYSIARSIVELSANICYILAEGPEVAEQMMRHARQKAHRDRERESRIGQQLIRLVWSAHADQSIPNPAEEEMLAFTSRQGREKAWIDLSIDERIAAAANVFGDPVLTSIHFARFMVYRHSSEILHGTLLALCTFSV